MKSLFSTSSFSSTSANTPVSFIHKGGSGLFTRYLALDGEPAYELSFSCGTCYFLFERLGGANSTINVHEVDKQFYQGLTTIDEKLLLNIAPLIPAGKYTVILHEIFPVFVTPGAANDYFSQEQVHLWGVDPFWGLPHYPKTEYYRTSTVYNASRGYFEFVVPMVPKNWLDQERLEKYRYRLAQGEQPTALAISVLDVKQPADWNKQVVTEHWCLAHFLLDGHHKVYAAAQSGKSITLLSFLARDESIASQEAIDLYIQEKLADYRKEK